ncbi:insulinase family protein [Puteibacter caeruleilacunae]|nr:insulinase family protein [Puteibacter caeruleilacunae]
MISTLNRNIAPDNHPITHIPKICADETKLSNGIPVYSINAGSQDVVKIDIIFNAGLWQQDCNLQATLSNAMLNEGTSNNTAAQIAETFDFHGAYIQLGADQHYGNISIITLNRHLDKIIEVTSDLIINSEYPEQEFHTQIQKRRNKFTVENEKVKTMCQKNFTQIMFGNDHPYALNTKVEDYDSITREKLLKFYKQNYQPNNCKIILSGRITDSTIKTLDKYLGNGGWSDLSVVTPSINPQIITSSQLHHHIQKADAIQTALRMGKFIPNKDHADYPELNIVNTILGGYFGSRLMANIREDKGYTYGIYSVLLTLKEAAYFFITTETGNEVSKATIEECQKELKRMRTEPVGLQELDTVKAYMMGEILRDLDGPFALAANLRGMLEFNLDNNFIDQQINAIKNITPERILELSNKYLNEEEMHIVTAGS